MDVHRTEAVEPFRLGEHRIVPATCEIDGVRIDAKSMDVLVALADAAPAALSPAALLDRVWRDMVVVDNVVYQAITHLRKALRDDAHVPRCIETIPRRGYRVIAPIDRRKVSGDAGTATRVQRISIAVLPFANLSSDVEQAHFTDGLVEELITRLSRVAALRVVSRSSAFSYRGRDVRLPDVARELAVAYVVEGSVRRAGKRVRVTVQLLDARLDSHVWSAAFDRDYADPLALEDEIAAAAVLQISTSLTGGAEGAAPP